MRVSRLLAGLGLGLTLLLPTASSARAGSWFHRDPVPVPAPTPPPPSGLAYHGQPAPNRTNSCLYGYFDYVYGRGPLPNLGGASLAPGFRGYGLVNSPGYGLGTMPSSYVDINRPSKLALLLGLRR